MKIGIDARRYGEKYTGIGIYAKELIEGLLRLDSENEYVIFLGKESFPSAEFSRPVKKVLADIPWYSLKEQMALPRIFEKEKLDFLHFTNFNVPLFSTTNFAVTVHDMTPWQFPGHKTKKNFLRRLCFHAVFDSMMKRAKKIFTVSEHTRAQLLKRYAQLSHKILVTYPGLNLQFQPPQNYGIIEEFKRKFFIEKPFIFYVGVWREHKNIPGLISAFELLRNVYHEDLQLVIGGYDENPDPEISKSIERLKLKEHILTPGFLSTEDLSLFYSAAELTVIPSFQEGFGLVGIESLACGTPVAASKTTSIKEVLSDSALYFDPRNIQEMAETMLKIFSDEKLSQKLVLRGKEIIQKYSWDECARKTLDAYKKISQL